MTEQPRCDCGKRTRAACLAWGCGDLVKTKRQQIIDLLGMVNASKAQKMSFNKKFQRSNEVHEVRAREVDRA